MTAAARRGGEAHLVLRVTPDPLLRRVSAPVERFDRSLRGLVQDMQHVMSRHQGIGLAAPQVGVELRLFVCEIGGEVLAIVNPRIRLCETGTEVMAEGCLSLPGVSVPVTRASAALVQGHDPRGTAVSFVAQGLWARVVQHEADHLDGRLITDYASKCGASNETSG
jgi:peptide deformylase